MPALRRLVLERLVPTALVAGSVPLLLLAAAAHGAPGRALLFLAGGVVAWGGGIACCYLAYRPTTLHAPAH